MADYYTRALKARDPRYKIALDRLGYGTRHMAAEPEAPSEPANEDELKALRAEYTEKVGKKPFHGWDAETLREKMAEADEDEG